MPAPERGLLPTAAPCVRASHARRLLSPRVGTRSRRARGRVTAACAAPQRPPSAAGPGPQAATQRPRAQRQPRCSGQRPRAAHRTLSACKGPPSSSGGPRRWPRGPQGRACVRARCHSAGRRPCQPRSLCQRSQAAAGGTPDLRACTRLACRPQRAAPRTQAAAAAPRRTCRAPPRRTRQARPPCMSLTPWRPRRRRTTDGGRLRASSHL
mmetsp:Transcript_12278/g.51691  ORF Transcript_12278/g.51691 Transcript_12278/m.51691 type:complete len:210 (+) Transcript_12278:2455-3084(+)